jgi:hypothetical protein
MEYEIKIKFIRFDHKNIPSKMLNIKMCQMCFYKLLL